MYHVNADKCLKNTSGHAVIKKIIIITFCVKYKNTIILDIGSNVAQLFKVTKVKSE